MMILSLHLSSTPSTSTFVIYYEMTPHCLESSATGMIHGGGLGDTGRPLKILSTSFHS